MGKFESSPLGKLYIMSYMVFLKSEVIFGFCDTGHGVMCMGKDRAVV
jgi:hypothetical protein